MAKTRQVVEQFDDVMFLRAPLKWPSWPLCPLKRPSVREGAWPQQGFAMDVTDGQITVFLGNMFEYAETHVLPTERIAYADAAATVSDGWLVD
jgi:hypothetical protein